MNLVLASALAIIHLRLRRRQRRKRMEKCGLTTRKEQILSQSSFVFYSFSSVETGAAEGGLGDIEETPHGFPFV